MTTRKKRSPTFVILGLTVLSIITFFLVNWVYHVVRKPSELLGLAGKGFYKNPKQTWDAYGSQFVAFSTRVISPDLLAALAQTETAGNSIARTYWQWNFAARNPFEIYAPASSAVGLLQITDGTFKVAKRYCVHDGEVLKDGPWYDYNSCWFNGFYNRLIPSHAIEMTSAYLHVTVQDILKTTPVLRWVPMAAPPEKKTKKSKKAKKSKKPALLLTQKKGTATVEEMQDLAAYVHLCGAKKGAHFVREGFHPAGTDKCGSLRPSVYLAQVHKYRTLFSRYLKKESSLPKN